MVKPTCRSGSVGLGLVLFALAGCGKSTAGYPAPGKEPFPALIYLHGTGGDRTELLEPAAWMAARRSLQWPATTRPRRSFATSSPGSRASSGWAAPVVRGAVAGP